ncbi:MAG: hypothetical protein V3T40_04790, partial [Nitrososphaerales archaeon]
WDLNPRTPKGQGPKLRTRERPAPLARLGNPRISSDNIITNLSIVPSRLQDFLEEWFIDNMQT